MKSQIRLRLNELPSECRLEIDIRVVLSELIELARSGVAGVRPRTHLVDEPTLSLPQTSTST